MRDILGKEIVGYEEACYLKEVRFNWFCTGYYHCDDYGEDEWCCDDEKYECIGWRGLFRNSFSLFRAAAPSKKAAELLYTLHKVKPYNSLKDYDE